MLSRLHVRNFAIVSQLDLDFARGMTVFTGETGAGKSIIIEALGLVLGDRADSNMLRTGAQRGEVTAVFEHLPAPALNRLRELGLEGDEAECMIRRQINSDGRSRAFVNGSPVPLQVLREMREDLIEIHGQHEHQGLLRSDHQRALLDGFASHTGLLTAVSETHGHWHEVRAQLLAVEQLGSMDTATRELLRYQVAELQELEFDPAELAALEQDQLRLSNLSDLVMACAGAQRRLDGDDDGGIHDALNSAARELEAVRRFEPRLQAVLELLNAATINVDEAARELTHVADDLETDPDRLAQVEQRLGDLHQAARKHKVRMAELPGVIAALSERLAAVETAASRRDELQALLESCRADYVQAAKALSKSRQDAARRLAKAVTRRLVALDMNDGALRVDSVFDEAGAPSARGLDKVEFLMRTNAGQAFRPLSKIASGGELSRISLAIRVESLGEGGAPTLIFDEVDAGIGGRVGEIVGQQLRALGEHRQVLCVTHLAQVASLSHQHMVVSKDSDGATTQTEVQRLDDPQRIQELARMLGGVKITDKTIGHAREMLAHGRGH